MNEPWYRYGLKFACTGCGDCCTGAPGYVWVNVSEIEALASAVGIPVEEFQRRYVRQVGIRRSLIEFANGDCVFFDNASRKCRVYDARPRQCRTWPFWASNLATPEAWEEIAERCPGCNRGRRVPLGKIVARL
jgi:Fe-S-cluster containining protein